MKLEIKSNKDFYNHYIDNIATYIEKRLIENKKN